MINGSSLMKVESIAECSPWSILQYIWAALSVNWYWKPIFAVFLDKNRQKKILVTNGNLMKVESIAESILQYLWPALSDNWYWNPIFVLWEWPFYTGFTVLTKDT